MEKTAYEMTLAEWQEVMQHRGYEVKLFRGTEEWGIWTVYKYPKNPLYAVWVANKLISVSTALYVAADKYNNYLGGSQMAKKKEDLQQPAEEVKAVECAPEVKEEILAHLKKINRDGTGDLIEMMEDSGFFSAPASGGNHCYQVGGLAVHSLNVCHIAEQLTVTLFGGGDKIPKGFMDSVHVVALLHDLGKCGDYGKQMYVPNILKSGEQSKAKPWERNKALLPVSHAERSCRLLERAYYDFSEEEAFAIRYHDGLYERANYDLQGHETPLYMILHFADMWASRVVEVENTEEEN